MKPAKALAAKTVKSMTPCKSDASASLLFCPALWYNKKKRRKEVSPCLTRPSGSPEPLPASAGSLPAGMPSSASASSSPPAAGSGWISWPPSCWQSTTRSAASSPPTLPGRASAPACVRSWPRSGSTFSYQQRGLWRVRQLSGDQHRGRALHGEGQCAGHAPAVQVRREKDGGSGLRHRAQRGLLGRPAAGWSLYGGLLRQQGLRCQPDPGRGPGTAGAAQPGLRVCALPGAGGYRVQRAGRGGVCPLKGISPPSVWRKPCAGCCGARPSSCPRP